MHNAASFIWASMWRGPNLPSFHVRSTIQCFNEAVLGSVTSGELATMRLELTKRATNAIRSRSLGVW